MHSWVLAFLLGISSLLFLPDFISITAAWCLLAASVIALIFLRKYQFCIIIIAIVMGIAWGWLHADQELALNLPENLQDQPLIVKGIISSIPEIKTNDVTFIFAVNEIENTNIKFKPPLLVKLQWVNFPRRLQVGDEWCLSVKLKRPRGFWTPGVFDYEKWLFEQRIRATGYVSSGNNTCLGSAFINFIDRARQRLANDATTQLQNRPLAGLVTALAVGIRTNISETQWTVLEGTGTNHLFAIAGLHVGFVTGIVLTLINFFWRFSGRLSLYLPAPQAAAFGSLLAAIFYCALAGFSLPTQRALLMVLVFLLAKILRKKLSAWSSWCLALLIILFLDPLVVLSDSFWLSFSAVALIIYGLSGRIKQHGIWWHWGRAQWVMSVGLIPCSLLFFQQTTLASFIANVIAIPWIGFVVLPLVLLGDLVWFVIPKLSGFFWLLAEYTLEWLWPILNHIAAINAVQWQLSLNNNWIFCSACIAVILLLLPQGFKIRWLGLIWILPLAFAQSKNPLAGGAWFTLLDVGQGLAIVVRTEHHVLVYHNANNDNDIDEVVLPFLQYQGVRNVDAMVINQKDDAADNTSLFTPFVVKQIYSNLSNNFNPGTVLSCNSTQSWQWDGVSFQMLYPDKNQQNNSVNNSCVLKIIVGQQSILLTGDIQQKNENVLLQTSSNYLASTILVAPHHGSKTSSSINFVNSVHPHIVLFSAGYLNRYHYPDAEIIARYQAIGAKTYSTADVGSITFKLPEKDNSLLPETYSNKDFHFWDN